MINDNNLLLPHHLRYASYTLNLLATTDFYNALKNSIVHSRIHYAYYLANALHCGMHHGENNSEIIHNALLPLQFNLPLFLSYQMEFFI